jgi:AraC family transcriptional regulator
MGQALLGRDFRVQETHGILMRSEHSIRDRSDDLGWRSLYASVQHEAPYEASFNAVEDHLLILHLNGPVAVERRLGAKVERRVVPPGGLFILPGGLDFGVRLEGELDTLHIYLRNAIVREVAGELGIEHDDLALRPSLGEPDPLAESLALAVRQAMLDTTPGTAVYVDYLSRVLAARLLRRYSWRAVPESGPCGGLTRIQMALVEDFIEEHLCASLSLDDLARACELSPSYFARRFKGSTGLPPHQYLIHKRVERAKRLLRTAMPIVEVALECGFSHQEHLTNVFRRATGQTPAAYRRAVQF